MVDEAHAFKNLAIFSKMNNVSGISSSGSKKATDMQLKCQYISEISGNRGIVFATGTPISNTMCEMYVMQLYLQKPALEQMGIYHFDSWAANFGEVTTALELTVEGSGFRFKSRFNKFTNLPELMNIYREVADVQTADMLDLDVPGLRGGKAIIVESEPDWYVKQVMEDFVVRAERIRNGGVDPSVDNFLKITHEARLLGTDARLIDRDAPNNPDGKLNKVAENVWKEYREGNKDGKIGCQLIFSDIGTPGADKDFTVYQYLKDALILEIESIGIRYPVVEGCSSANLNKAIGHLSETGKIGEKGNCVLAGHNGSRYGEFFTKLNQVTTGDVVALLDTEGTLHTYEVTETFVVGPYDNSIKTQRDTEELTLFTCAERGTKRFVVKCVPVREECAYGE